MEPSEQQRPSTQTLRTGPGRLAWWLDRSIPLPGGYRVGLDGIIGLIPGVGDAIGGGLGAWIVHEAWRAGVPGPVLARMIVNLLVDAVLGAVPVVGDLFDLFFQANMRNMRLIERYRVAPREAARRSALETGFVIIGVLVAVGGLVWALIALLRLLWQAVAGA